MSVSERWVGDARRRARIARDEADQYALIEAELRRLEGPQPANHPRYRPRPMPPAAVQHLADWLARIEATYPPKAGRPWKHGPPVLRTDAEMASDWQIERQQYQEEAG